MFLAACREDRSPLADQKTDRTVIVALTGFMGSGKTMAGRALAALLGWEFVDLDEMIEQREGVRVREIFAQRGEAEFRKLEHMALEEFVSGCAKPTVVALGGGTFVQPQNEAILNQSHVRSVFLDVAVDEMLLRCNEDDREAEENPRPLAQDAERFRRMYEDRQPHYRRASVTLNASGKDPDEVARAIAEVLQLTAAE